MSFLELDGNRHEVPAGEAIIGSGPASFLVIEDAGILPEHAVVVSAPDGQVSVRRVSEEAPVLINGVPMGPQPAPLLHGDKIKVGERELTFVDERRSGSTQFVTVAEIAELQAVKPKAGRQRVATTGTGGRLVSLTDGREYMIEGTSLVIGREASCDVVIAKKRVSRRHAEILATPKGYVIIDMSSNGVFVNGERVAGERLLARADVLRVGDDEFRFYADSAPQPAPEPAAAPEAPPEAEPPAPVPAAGSAYKLGDTMHGLPPSLPSEPPAAPPSPPAPGTAQAAPGAAYRLGDTLHGIPGGLPPASPAPAPPPATPPEPAVPGASLAMLLVRSGQLKGHRFQIRFPVVNVGRADYNDIVIPDSSVSSAHCKIQLREGVWILVDLDSTNGSFLDGERVLGEAPVAPGALLRFGDVSVVFDSTKDDSAQPGGGTQLLGAIKDPPPGGD
ncbi:MAG: FHA domain-containing protein [Gemmatimonadetes bacterium]|nr:FHA domain-containing protein [Gemmatimonadota bacterium]